MKQTLFLSVIFMTAMLVSCVKESFMEEQVMQPAAPHVYNLSVSASKYDDTETTKALELDGKTLIAFWTEGDKVSVFNDTRQTILLGELVAQASGVNTLLEGKLSGTIETGDQLILRYVGPQYAMQDGTLEHIAAHCDFAEAAVSVTDASSLSVTTTAARFENRQSIVKLDFTDGVGEVDVASVVISAEGGQLVREKQFSASGNQINHSGYVFDGSTFSQLFNEGDKLIDGNLNTYWGSVLHHGSFNYVEFHTPSLVRVDGYRLTTTGNSASEYWKIPDNWVLKAKVNREDEWMVIDARNAQNEHCDLPRQNRASREFGTAVRGEFQYFRFEVHDVVSNTAGMALCELQLFCYEGNSFIPEYGSVTVKPETAAHTCYVALCNDIAAAETYNFTVLGADGCEYAGTRSGIHFENGKFYTLSVKLEKTGVKLLSDATRSDVGKIVCAAGHLHPAKEPIPAGCTAVGVLGRVTSLGQGLILALEDAALEERWDFIVGWKAATYAGTTLRVLPNERYRNNLKSYTSIGLCSVSDWAVAEKSDYESIFLNLGSTRRNNEGLTYDDHVNAYVTGAGGVAINGVYWSTTQDATYYSWGFKDDGWFRPFNADTYRMRPVLGFKRDQSVLTPEGAIKGLFSVSDTKKIYFSKGNLQYVGSWQFAASQWERFGTDQRDNHRDLFGWGTKDHPNNVSQNNSDYSWAEWGENTITNGTTGYRTLTLEEWHYLKEHSTRSLAKIEGVYGLVILPDEWTLPEGCSFTVLKAGYTDDMKNANVYTPAQWALMEAGGAVFLPFAGIREGTTLEMLNEMPFYWSSTPDGGDRACLFSYTGEWATGNAPRSGGLSVRLVKDAW